MGFRSKSVADVKPALLTTNVSCTSHYCRFLHSVVADFLGNARLKPLSPRCSFPFRQVSFLPFQRCKAHKHSDYSSVFTFFFLIGHVLFHPSNMRQLPLFTLSVCSVLGVIASAAGGVYGRERRRPQGLSTQGTVNPQRTSGDLQTIRLPYLATSMCLSYSICRWHRVLKVTSTTACQNHLTGFVSGRCAALSRLQFG